jgi:hypothetical protein
LRQITLSGSLTEIGAADVYCSITTCALIPPKPNALMAARRGPVLVHGLDSAIGSNRVAAISARGSSQPSVGGSTPL